jgi:hypothetical protein
MARELIWANLIHLSYNMWCDRALATEGDEQPHIVWDPRLRFDDGLWSELVVAMVEAGINMVVLDLGDGVRYRSRPEIAVEGAWRPERLRRELRRLRQVGIEPIPKLNFSTAHDAWLGPYARMVSTPAYYEVCGDLIREVCALFDGPRFFHLGMDEETADHQRDYALAMMRQHELWWHDLAFLVGEVERTKSRAWVWSDYVWARPAEFYARMPRTVVQSNWYYEPDFAERKVADAPEAYEYRRAFLAYDDMDAAGFEQVPTGSNWSHPDNFGALAAYCREHIAPERLLGFLQTPWKPTLPECRAHHLAAIEQVARARADWPAAQPDAST